MDRYEECFRLLPWMYAQGSPVILPESVLLRDPEQGDKRARLQIMNLDSRTLTGCRVRISCLGPCGEPLDGAEYAYGPLSVPGGALFGGEETVPLPNPDTAIIGVQVLELTFQDGSRWEGTDGRWEPLPEPRTVEMLFPEPELARAYRETVGEPCVQAPRLHQGLFLCACGAVNGDPDAPCRSCGRTFPELAMAMNEERLRAAAEERRAREELQHRRTAREAEAKRQRKEEAKTHRREAGRYILIAAILVVVLGVLAWVVPNVVVPRVKNEQAFAAAEELLEQGLYDEASAAFLTLGEYKEADRMALESLYQKAVSLRDQGKYADAVSQFEELGDFRDSAAQAEDTLEQWKEADYQAARALVDAGAYPAAAAAFEALGDYKDAAEWVFECQMLQREYDYDAALAAMEAGEYSRAADFFDQLGDYRESRDLADRCRELQRQEDYKAACGALEAKDYAAAETAFAALGSYEDAADKLLEARYALGCQLLQQEDYTGAIEKLSLCGDYQNTDWNLKQAKMGYARTHADREDEKTLSYLKELKAVYFQGAKTLYDEIFGWKVEITSFSNKEWGENQQTLSKYGVLYVHFKLTGGEPGQSLVLRTVLTVPGGNRGTIYHNDVSEGYTGYSSFWFHDPDRAPTGTLTFQAYDEAGNLLCTGSVKVTN